MTRILWKALAAAAAMVAAGCFNYDNPVEYEQRGTIRGQLVSAESSAAAPGTSRLAPGSTPVVGAGCTLEGTSKTATSDAQGNFELTKVPVGSYILICREGERAFLAAVEVKADQVTDLGVLEITPTGRIQGFARLSGQSDHSGIAVQVPGTSFQATTDASGAYALAGLPKGAYALRFEKAGFVAFELANVNVTPRATTLLGDVTLTLSTGPNGTLVINGGAPLSAAREVMVTIGASSNAALMILSESGNFLDAKWEPIATSKPWTFREDGLRSLYAKFADANGLESPPTSATIRIDTQPPTGTVQIKGGAEATNSVRVPLTLTGADATTSAVEMMIANDEQFTGASWEPYAATRSWDLSAGDGSKSVFVKFKDQAGNVMPAACTASIALDTVAPTDPHIEIKEGNLTNIPTIGLILSASGASWMKIGESEDLSNSPLQRLESPTIFNLSPGDGQKRVYAQFFDEAGNTSAVVSAITVLDTPGGPGFVSIDSRVTNQRLVHLTIGGSGFTEMKISEDPSFAGAEPVPFSTSAEWTLSPGDGPKTVYVTFKKISGIWGATATATVELDTTGPVGNVFINNSEPKTTSETVTLTFAVTDSHAIREICISMDGTFTDCTWESFAPGDRRKVTFSSHATDDSATLVVHVKLKDEAGNASKDLTSSILLERKLMSGVLPASETWAAGVPYVLNGDVGVPAGVTLTLAPGVEVQYAGAYKILVKGAIVANGTLAAPIKFTATPNLAFSGATQLQFEEANLNSSQLSHVLFEKARDSAYPTGSAGGAGIMVSNTNCPASNTGMLTLSNAEVRAPLLSYMCGSGVRMTIESSTVSGTLFEGGALVKGGAIGSSRLVVSSLTASGTNISGSRVDLWGDYLLRLEQGASLTNSAVGTSASSGKLQLSKAHLTNAYLDMPQAEVDIADSTLTYDGAYVPEPTGSDFQNKVRIGWGAMSYSSFSDATTGTGISVGDGANAFSLTYSDVTSKGVALVTSAEGSFSMSHCNLLGSPSFALKNISRSAANAAGNYWGTASESEIKAKIYDGQDNSLYGLVDYSGFLTARQAGSGPRP